MTLLLRPKRSSKLRGRWGVQRIAQRVPKNEKHDEAWWLEHFHKWWAQGG